MIFIDKGFKNGTEILIESHIGPFGKTKKIYLDVSNEYYKKYCERLDKEPSGGSTENLDWKKYWIEIIDNNTDDEIIFMNDIYKKHNDYFIHNTIPIL